MKSNISGIDENGDEFEIDYEDYQAMQEEEIEVEGVIQEENKKIFPQLKDKEPGD